jgi:hypothetical protein
MTKVTPVEAGNRIELPADWVAELGLSQYAALERTEAGILVQACLGSSWDEVFARKLQIHPPSAASEELQVTGDDVLL